jgi:hypothetical protein
MPENIDLKDLEKQTWISNFQDGIVDISLGLVLLVSTICQLFNDFRYYLYLLFAIPPLFVVFSKKYIIAPRMGFVKFSKERNKKRHVLYVVMTVTIILLLVLTVFSKVNIFGDTIPAQVIVGSQILIICSAIAYFLNFSRMYLYGILMTFSFALSEIMIVETGMIASGAYAWLISAIIVIMAGIYYLVRFIRKYPVPAKEIPDGSEQ